MEVVQKAGGDVYGGVLSYRPTSNLTFSGTFDRTINIASQLSADKSALTLPALSRANPIGYFDG